MLGSRSSWTVGGGNCGPVLAGRVEVFFAGSRNRRLLHPRPVEGRLRQSRSVIVEVVGAWGSAGFLDHEAGVLRLHWFRRAADQGEAVTSAAQDAGHIKPKLGRFAEQVDGAPAPADLGCRAKGPQGTG